MSIIITQRNTTETLGSLRDKENQAGFAFILIPIVLVVVVGFIIFFGSSYQSNTGAGTGYEDEFVGLQDIPVNQGVVTDCLFYNKNPRVRAVLVRDPSFVKSLIYYSALLGYHQNDMMGVFRIECDFNWHIVNAYGCGGMFQLCPISEKITGITGRHLATLQPSQQMGYMYRYFRAMGCHRDPPHTKTMTNAYLCVFLPAHRKKPPAAYIWPRGVNPLHDVDDNGKIYKWEVDCNMTSSYAIGAKSCGINLPLCSMAKVKPRKQDY